MGAEPEEKEAQAGPSCSLQLHERKVKPGGGQPFLPDNKRQIAPGEV